MQVNDKINYLTLISKNGQNGLFRCDCGNEKNIRISSVKSNNTKSCGCHRKKQAVINGKKANIHGLSNHYLFHLWQSICRKKYPICNEWKEFKVFYDWCLSKNWSKGLTITCKDFNLGYNPDNCIIVSSNEAKRNSTNYTCKQKYGCHHTQLESVKAKIRQTNLERYGVSVSSQNEEVKQKSKDTCLKKYGVTHHMLVDEIKLKVLNNSPPVNCRNSKQEEEIKNWINSISDKKFINNFTILNGKEIDLFNGENLAIEYCGLFWHCEDSPEPRTRLYHYNKYLACIQQNIRLITIFSDEWTNRNYQIKSYIENILNYNTNKIYARNCITKKLDINQTKEFIDQYHIQKAPSNILYSNGIFYQDDLIGIISLGRHHRDSNQLVLNRLCFKSNNKIIGGVSKLLKDCIFWAKDNKYNQIITWSDNRWSNGNVYENVGFIFDGHLPPDYSYVNLKKDTSKRISKQSVKNKIPKEYSEKDWMHLQGYSRIWDCGKKRWIYNL